LKKRKDVETVRYPILVLTCHNMKVQWFTDSCDICFISKYEIQENWKRAYHNILWPIILKGNCTLLQPT